MSVGLNISLVCGLHANFEQVHSYKVPLSVTVLRAKANSVKDRLVTTDLLSLIKRICWCKRDKSFAADKYELSCNSINNKLDTTITIY